MSDATITALAGAGTALLAAIGTFLRWAVKLWADIRREAIKAESEASAHQRQHNERLLELQRQDNARMREALVEQSRSNATLVGKLDQVIGVLTRAERR